MKRVNNKKNLYKSIILLTILVIGIGYAYLTSNLSITGSTEVVANTWDIHFENLQVTSGSVTATTPASIDSNETSIEYAITLSRPKDFYEFTVDVVNEGTLPGKVSISELSGLDTTSSKVVDYTIAYTNGNPVSVGDILNGGTIKTIKVRVYYKDDITEEDFPENNLNLNLTYTLQFVQSEDDEAFNVFDTIVDLSSDNECISKYEGDVTDQPGETVTASNVYFNKCVDKRNIKFAGYCWQMIRTTETGGIKMIYNGEPDNNGECGSSRGDHKGIVQLNNKRLTINTEYLYGSSFTYDTSTNEFTLIDTETATWSDSTYENLIGKFTCETTSNTCETLYEVNAYYSNMVAYLSYYTIDDTNYAQIGKSSFNAYGESPAMLGYMFNKVYDYNSKTDSSLNSTIKVGSTFNYNTTTNTYTLSGTTKSISNWNNEFYNINNTHYTCWNTSGSCSVISYIYETDSSLALYVNLMNGKNINDALVEMFSTNDVNRYNSSIKGIIDAWYAKNLSTKTNVIEDIVYCSSRYIREYGGWNPNGGSTSWGESPYQLELKGYGNSIDLTCPNETDQFSLSNNRAKLTYPVALLQTEEYNNINNSSLMTTGEKWRLLSPVGIYSAVSSGRVVTSSGTRSNENITLSNGLRPVISLAPGAVITDGTGSESDPWVIRE